MRGLMLVAAGIGSAALASAYLLLPDLNANSPNEAASERPTGEDVSEVPSNRRVRVVGPPFYPDSSDKFDRIFRNGSRESELVQAVEQVLAFALDHVTGQEREGVEPHAPSHTLEAQSDTVAPVRQPGSLGTLDELAEHDSEPRPSS